MEGKIVIFGASGGAVKVLQIFQNMRIEVAFLVDNNPAKWGDVLEGHTVYSPDKLEEGNYRIVIASVYQDAIEEQLKKKKLLENIFQKEYFILEYAWKHLTEINETLSPKVLETKSEKVFIELLDEGIVMNGAVNWAITLLQGLELQGIEVELLARKNKNSIPDILENKVQLLEMCYSNYWVNVKRIVSLIFANLPCTIITNTQNQGLIAGAIAKKFYPNKVRIISVIHNDRKDVYRKQSILEEYSDKIVCVSQKIKNTLHDTFDISIDKLFYKESPVEFASKIEKRYSEVKHEPLKIAYAARIQKSQKRADLLIPLIEALEKLHVNYSLKIAGEGSYFNELSTFLKEQSYARVTLLGKLAIEEMPQFWLDADIFLNLSDYEGTSLSMLESMSYGCIPVVTLTSGVEEFIKHGNNGYYVSLQNIEAMARVIQEVDFDRAKLVSYGERARETIRIKCNKDEYMKEFAKLLRR